MSVNFVGRLTRMAELVDNAAAEDNVEAIEAAAPPSPKSRGWCFTLNGAGQLEEPFAFDAVSMVYLVYQKEIGAEGGNEHFQGFVYFKNARSLVGVRLRSAAAHWEIMRGTPEQAAAYCKKDDTRKAGTQPAEFGVLPQQVRTNRRVRRRCALVH